MEVVRHFSVYSTMCEQKHSQTVVDNAMQTYIQENTAYDDTQELQHTMTYQKRVSANTA